MVRFSQFKNHKSPLAWIVQSFIQIRILNQIVQTEKYTLKGPLIS